MLADAAGEPLDAVAPASATDPIALLVGPEGGLAEEERERARAAGFRPARFAGHVLRTETAALVGAAILLRDASPGQG